MSQILALQALETEHGPGTDAAVVGSHLSSFAHFRFEVAVTDQDAR
ncbi:hypothetical protein ACIQOW_24720 [Kitasatospora sp. NPDC091335]